MSYKGIDISQHNGNVNFDIIKNEFDFVILRLGWVGNNRNELDTKFWEYYHECKRVGLPVGIYVFCYSKSVEAIENGARWVLQSIQKGDLELPIYIDMEDDESSSFKLSSLGSRKLTDMVIAFNSIIESSGQWAGVYANLDWWRNHLIKDELVPRYTSWIAHYGVSENRYENEYDMLQYSGNARVNGIKADTDLDIMYRDILAEINGSTPTPEPIPQPTPQKDIDEIVEEVIAGWWGNGEERKQRLEEAGYNYDEVQARVNARLAEDEYYPACDDSFNSIVDALNSIGIDSSFGNRKEIAEANGIYNYTGTATQNSRMLAKLKAERLKK